MRATALRHLAYSATLIIFSLTLTACGGNSGGPSPTSSAAAQTSSSGAQSSTDNASSESSEESSASSSASSSADTEPDAFELEAQSGVALGALVSSPAVTITGIDAETPVSIEGGGQYAIDEGEFTTEAGTISAGQSLTVQLTAPDDFESTASTILTVGGVSAQFSVTTVAADTTPEAFSFTDQSGVARGALVQSDTITITGIDADTAVSIEGGGQYAIEEGDFTADAGTVSAGQSLVVQLTASDEFLTTAGTTLTVGGVSAEFNVTTAAPDTTPDAFSFEPQANVARDTQVSSAAVPITGIDAPSTVSLQGEGAYAIDGSTFTSADGTLNPGQSVAVQLTAAADFDTPASVTLTVGGVSADFTVTTEARDTTPDTFSFAPLDEQEPDAEVTSQPVTINGINAPAEVTIENGQYAIDGGTPTSAPGQIDDGQTLTLYATAPAKAGITKEVTATVGGVAGVFAVSTLEDTEPPEAAFVFPTPMTATEAGTVIVRGTASDELSAITRVTLTVSAEGGSTADYEAETEDDFATWQKQLDLSPGENTITVVAEDEHGNTLTDGVSVTVEQQALVEAFPDDTVGISSPKAVVFDEERDRFLIADSVEDRVIAVGLSTGVRSVFADSDEGLPLRSANGLVIDTKRERLLVSAAVGISNGVDGVVGVDLTTGEKSLVSSRTHPSEDQPEITRPSGLAIDSADSGQGYVLGQGSRNLAALDLEKGLRALISDNDMPDSGTAFDSARSLLIDKDNDRAFVADFSKYILEVDLLNGERKVFLGEGVPNETISQACTFSLVADDISKRLIFVQNCERELWAMDVETKEITVLAAGDTPRMESTLKAITALSLSPDNQYLVAAGDSLGIIHVVDIKTGQWLILSKPAGEF